MFLLVTLLMLIVLLIAGSAILLTFVFAPGAEDKIKVWQVKKEKAVEKELEDLYYYDRSPQYIVRLHFILPPVLGIVGYAVTRSMLIAFIGVFIGLIIPTIALRLRSVRRRQKFSAQILDAIMVLSSSLKGGLSLLQAIEVLVTEMPVPISQEMGLVVKENKMGITLEESLKRLDKRMAMEDLSLVINSILVARETGGDLTKVFSRLTTTIRDNRKLKDNIRTLTLQGKIQGVVMSVLPIVFFFWVLNFNKHHFDVMLQSELGRTLLITAGVLQILGMVMIYKFSKIKI